MTYGTLPEGYLLSHNGISPEIDTSVFLAPTAAIIGNVVIAENASVWFGNDTQGTLSKSAEHYRLQALNYRSGKVQLVPHPSHHHQEEDSLHEY